MPVSHPKGRTGVPQLDFTRFLLFFPPTRPVSARVLKKETDPWGALVTLSEIRLHLCKGEFVF